MNSFFRIIKKGVIFFPKLLIRFFKRLKSNYYLNKKIKSEGKFKIVFICQCEYIWDKQRCIVERLSKNKEFNIVLLILQDNGKIDDTVFERFAIEKQIDFYKYELNILKKIKPNIICYPRPYDFFYLTI